MHFWLLRRVNLADLCIGLGPAQRILRDEIIPPIRARKARYYEHARLLARFVGGSISLLLQVPPHAATMAERDRHGDRNLLTECRQNSTPATTCKLPERISSPLPTRRTDAPMWPRPRRAASVPPYRLGVDGIWRQRGTNQAAGFITA
jgi:hypothetical protein